MSVFNTCVPSRILWSQSSSPSCGWSAPVVGPKLCPISRRPRTQRRCFCSSQPAELRKTSAPWPRSLSGPVCTRLRLVSIHQMKHWNTKVNENKPFTPLSRFCLQVFGFVNVVLWVGNIWFVFKETGWYKTGQRYPTRSASGKRSSQMRQRLYSESSFDQPEEGSGHSQFSRQGSFNQSKGGSGPQVHRQASFSQAQVTLSLPQTYLNKPVIYETKVASPGPKIFVNEMWFCSFSLCFTQWTVLFSIWLSTEWKMKTQTVLCSV